MTDYRLWPATDGPGAQSSDGTDYTLGLTFYVTAQAWLTKVRFWAAEDFSTSDHIVQLWAVDSSGGDFLGPLLAAPEALPAPLQGPAWNEVTLAEPYELTPNQLYRVGVYFTVNNGYTATGGYWTGGGDGAFGVTNGILVAPSADQLVVLVGVGNQCSFDVDGPIAYPNNVFNAANYWIDPGVTDVDPTGGDEPLEGAFAGASPLPAAALAGEVSAAAVLAGSSPLAAAALAGDVVDAGALEGSAPLPSGGLAGVVRVAGALDATLPLPAVALTGGGVLEGALAGALPLPVGSFAGDGEALGEFAAVLPLPAAALTGEAYPSGSLTAAAPLPSGALAAAVRLSGVLTAAAPLPVAVLEHGSTVDYPIHAGAVTDNGGRFRAGTVIDNLAE